MSERAPIKMKMSQSEPHPLVFHPNEGEEMFRITADGRFVFADGVEVEEAAREFARWFNTEMGHLLIYPSATAGDEEKAGPVGDMGPRSCEVCGQHYSVDDGNIECPFCATARDEPEGARAARLRKALKPFANYACDPPCGCHNCEARAALTAEPPTEVDETHWQRMKREAREDVEAARARGNAVDQAWFEGMLKYIARIEHEMPTVQCEAIDRKVEACPVVCTRKAGHEGSHYNKSLMLEWNEPLITEPPAQEEKPDV